MGNLQTCPNCHKEQALRHPLFGVLIGAKCQKKQQNLSSPGGYIEFTSEDIKRQRVDYADDILQPYRSGEVSKRYIQKYGTKGIEVTDQEMKQAMDKPDVWSGDDTYYRD